MTTHKLRLAAAALAATGAVVPAAAAHASSSHVGTVHVCKDGYVEQGPADHPKAPAYKGDTFVVQRAAYATVHHRNGKTEHFAKGKLVHRDKGGGKTYTYAGWISTNSLRCG